MPPIPTTFDGINLLCFASICLFRYIFNNFHGNRKPRKSCQNTENQSISGGKINMIKILFVCHGSILKSSWKACKIKDFTARKGAYYTTTTPIWFRERSWYDKRRTMIILKYLEIYRIKKGKLKDTFLFYWLLYK